jgi:hypothetical protein
VIKVSCATVGSQLSCRAVADINDLYVYCPMQQDVTQDALWSVGDATIIRAVAPGVFAAVGTGHTVVHAAWHAIDSSDYGLTPIAVFPGTPPLPTSEVYGNVSLAGQTLSSGPVTGAVIEMLDGVLAGQTAISGVPPSLLPGYLGPFGGPGYYRFLGVPPGEYRLRISKDGYGSQEHTAMVSTGSGSNAVNFELTPVH